MSIVAEVKQLEDSIRKLDALTDKHFARLSAYINAVNRIDDYFEYYCESTQDQAEVYRILKDLTDALDEINKG